MKKQEFNQQERKYGNLANTCNDNHYRGFCDVEILGRRSERVSGLRPRAYDYNRGDRCAVCYSHGMVRLGRSNNLRLTPKAVVPGGAGSPPASC